jgi:hypothetical protein
MNDPFQAIPQLAAQSAEPFPPNSRYHAIPRLTLARAGGSIVAYVGRRFIPQPEAFDLLLEHTVTESERLDNVAARHLGDPERFWQVCDANGVLRPEELVETPGRRLRITLPAGIPGAATSRG